MDEATRIAQAHRVQKLLDRAAYASLFFDIAIAMITLASLDVFRWSNTQALLTVVNYGLTAVVLVSVALFIILFFLTRGYNRLFNTIMGLPAFPKAVMNKIKF